MNVGDLIADCRSGEMGILVDINYEDPKISNSGERRPYLILDLKGRLNWYEQTYVEKSCETISENR